MARIISMVEGGFWFGAGFTLFKLGLSLILSLLGVDLMQLV
jgi:hypothetical protein